jgi:hypothetical protein
MRKTGWTADGPTVHGVVHDRWVRARHMARREAQGVTGRGRPGDGAASAGAWARVMSRRVGALAWMCCWSPVWACFSPKICTEVLQVMNREIVDLAILYNFHKGHLVFFSTDFAQKVCQLWMPLSFSEQDVLSFGQVFHLFPLKIWNANLHESCVPQQTGKLL